MAQKSPIIICPLVYYFPSVVVVCCHHNNIAFFLKYQWPSEIYSGMLTSQEFLNYLLFEALGSDSVTNS